MPQTSILSFHPRHINFAEYMVTIVNELGINYITIGDIKKHCQPRIILHKDLNVSDDRSPTTRAKIPGRLLFTTVQTQSLFFVAFC
jgi:hypothetical protein